MRTLKQRIELSAEPGFEHLDLGVGYAKGAVDLELNRPTGLLVWTSSPSRRGPSWRARRFPLDLPPLKWSSLKYGFAVEDRIDGKEEAYS